MTEWMPTRWELKQDIDDFKTLPITIELMNSPFYEGFRFAVRQGGQCLNTSGEWELEPIPSSRDKAFYDRCRHRSFQDAIVATRSA